MAPQTLTDYERKRLENIRRNEQLMASLKLQSMATQLSHSIKRPRADIKSYKVDVEKQPRTQDPTVIRRSLRTRGLPADAKGLGDDDSPESPTSPEASPRNLGPLSMRAVHNGVSSDRALIETILGIEMKPQMGGSVKGEFGRFEGENISGAVKGIGGLIKKEENGVESDLKLESLTLNQENIARVVPGNVSNMRFFPTSNLRMVVVGNRAGNVGFWNIDYKEEGQESGIYVYHPHSGIISGISIQQHCMSKIFTSCYDGFIRLMDVEKEVFDLVYSSDETICSLSQQSNDPKCLYFAEGRGGINLWDERTGNITAQWTPHDDRVNSIDFNSENSNIITTSSTDGTASIWDLRSIDADKFKSLKTVGHKRAVHSAYFSPSGRSLLTTSIDNTVGKSFLKFKAIWGWDDAHVFIGNKNGGIDVISPLERRTIFTLQSPYLSAIPCTLAAHPFNVGMLAAAGAKGRGQVHIWTLG
ncbi:hypothetical protein M0R45_003021 [Rubus argutus]|uniref:WD repeat-containing protein 76 n=1 Tax=Rubus argutus TaxID=59490 RepID=A0AAW1YFP2_RUBAR